MQLENDTSTMIHFSIPPVANTPRWLDKSHHMTPR